MVLASEHHNLVGCKNLMFQAEIFVHYAVEARSIILLCVPSKFRVAHL